MAGYFAFGMCEVKCGTMAPMLQIDRISLAVRGIVELHKAVKHEKEGRYVCIYTWIVVL